MLKFITIDDPISLLFNSPCALIVNTSAWLSARGSKEMKTKHKFES